MAGASKLLVPYDTNAGLSLGIALANPSTTDEVTVAGRIMLKRDQGKLIFCTLRDRSSDIQLFVSKSVVGDEAFDAINTFNLGDWVGVTGTVFPWHSMLALATIPVVLGHIYLAALNPATRESLRGITRGVVRRDWAAHHHPDWVPRDQ